MQRKDSTANHIPSALLALFSFKATTSHVQDLLLMLLKGPVGVLGLEPGSLLCKETALPATCVTPSLAAF